MAAGDFSVENHGTYDLSGSAALKTKIDSINIPSISIVSGAGLQLIPNGNGQVTVLEVNVI